MASDAYAKGMKTRRKVLGDEWVERAERSKTPFNEEFQRLITVFAWDGIWNRPHFPHRTRRLLVLAMMVALGRWEEFRLHVRAALESGDLDEEDLKEVLLQAAVYCGVPAANTAFNEARGVLEEPGARKSQARSKGKRR